MDQQNIMKAHVVSAAALLGDAAGIAMEISDGAIEIARELEAAVNHMQAAIRLMNERTTPCLTPKR